MNLFEQLTQQNNITPPFNYKIKLNNSTFSMSDVDEIQFFISFKEVIVKINADQIASFKLNKNALNNFGIERLIEPTNKELDNMPGTHTYSYGGDPSSDYIVFFVTDNEGFDEKINLNTIFKNILNVLKKSYKRHQNQQYRIVGRK